MNGYATGQLLTGVAHKAMIRGLCSPGLPREAHTTALLHGGDSRAEPHWCIMAGSIALHLHPLPRRNLGEAKEPT